MVERTPAEQALHDQQAAGLDEETAKILSIIRVMRRKEKDETALTDKVMDMMIEAFGDHTLEEALAGTTAALARMLVLLSRTDIFTDKSIEW